MESCLFVGFVEVLDVVLLIDFKIVVLRIFLIGKNSFIIILVIFIWQFLLVSIQNGYNKILQNLNPENITLGNPKNLLPYKRLLILFQPNFPLLKNSCQILQGYFPLHLHNILNELRTLTDRFEKTVDQKAVGFWQREIGDGQVLFENREDLFAALQRGFQLGKDTVGKQLRVLRT
jgi:hypothetical protein